MYKLLSGVSGVEAHHEYACTHIQPLAAKYFMGLISGVEAAAELKRIYGAAIYYSSAQYFVDASNKASWVVDILHELFPEARFIHIVRDGRKVASSFYYKLAPEIYDDVSVSILKKWLLNPKKYPEPPPEKKYWWNIPQKGQPHYDDFDRFNQFERISYHWTSCIVTINRFFETIPPKSALTMKLEDMVTRQSTLKKLFSFLTLPYESSYFDFLQTPRNVFFPMDFNLTEDQKVKFNALCADTMRLCGYTAKKAYRLCY